MVELLVVIAFVGLIAALAAPVVSGILGSQGITRAAYEAGGLLELARSEAIARQTYVWAGFVDVDEQGSSVVRMVAVYSKDGSGANLSPANLQGLTRTMQVKNAKLSAWSELGEDTRSLAIGKTPESVVNNANGLTFKVGKTTFNRTVAFTPRGEAILEGNVEIDTGYNPLIDISFRESKGGVVLPEANEISLLVEGATGAIKILRQ